MEINRDKLNQLAAMDDASLRGLIKSVVLQAGGSKFQAEMAAASTKKIKEKLTTATPEEIEKLVNLVGRDKAEKIMQGLELKE